MLINIRNIGSPSALLRVSDQHTESNIGVLGLSLQQVLTSNMVMISYPSHCVCTRTIL